MKTSVIKTNAVAPSAGENHVLHFTETKWNHSKSFFFFFGLWHYDRLASETVWLLLFFNSKSWGQSHVKPMVTLPACAAGLAWCQQLRALGVNHWHASVWQKAHSVSFDFNKLVVFLTSTRGELGAAFRPPDSLIHRSNNCIESETGKKKKTKEQKQKEQKERLTFTFVEGLPAWVSRALPAGPFRAASWREKVRKQKKSHPLQQNDGIKTH